MGLSHSVEEIRPTLDMEAPEVDEEVVAKYESDYVYDTVDSVFLYWWF